MLNRIGRTLLVVFLMFSGHLLNAVNCDFVVAPDGSGNFTSIQKAIDDCKAFPDNRITIFVKNGIYKEKLVYLGRPWRIYAKVAFLDCEMGSFICS